MPLTSSFCARKVQSNNSWKKRQLEGNRRQTDFLQEISVCRYCSSAGCRKCVQFHNWFQLVTIRPGLLEAWLVLTSVKYHGNLYILIPLNQRLALTRLRATGPRMTRLPQRNRLKFPAVLFNKYSFNCFTREISERCTDCLPSFSSFLCSRRQGEVRPWEQGRNGIERHSIPVWRVTQPLPCDCWVLLGEEPCTHHPSFHSRSMDEGAWKGEYALHWTNKYHVIRSIKKDNITNRQKNKTKQQKKRTKPNQKAKSHFQNEAKCKTFLAKTSFIALSLIFKQRLGAMAYSKHGTIEV